MCPEVTVWEIALLVDTGRSTWISPAQRGCHALERPGQERSRSAIAWFAELSASSFEPRPGGSAKLILHRSRLSWLPFDERILPFRKRHGRRYGFAASE